MNYWFRLFLLLLLPMISCPAFAGGAHQTTVSGVPIKWTQALTCNVDQGPLKVGVPQYDHNHAMQMVEDSFNTWLSALPSGGLTIQQGEDLPLAADGLGKDVNANNFDNYFGNSRPVNPIIFDADGEIIDATFGKCAKFSILAFAGFEIVNGGSVQKGHAVFSGACIPDANGKTETKDGCGPCVNILDDNEVRGIILHELGHLLGMDHSQVNPDSYGQCKSEGDCSAETAEDIPTMFPILVKGAAMGTLHQDDIAYFQRLYGNPSQESCSVSGKVFASDGQTELRGIEVVARNMASSQSHIDAISFVSGAEAPGFNGGDYSITGLSPGENYQLCVQRILPQFTGGSGINPVDPPVQGFSDDCPVGLTVTCQCSGSQCQKFENKNITTQVDSSLNATLDQNTDDPASSAGCSLVKPRSLIWPQIKKLLEFSSKLQ